MHSKISESRGQILYQTERKMKEESKFDLLREMGGEQGRKEGQSLLSSLVPSRPDILLLLRTKKEGERAERDNLDRMNRLALK